MPSSLCMELSSICWPFPGVDHVHRSANLYTKLVAPLAWRACETFIPRPSGDMVVTEASDVFMLGCTFIEVLTGCTREPYDWLMKEDPSGTALTVYRGHESTRNNNPLVVRTMRCGNAERCEWWSDSLCVADLTRYLTG